MFFWSRQHDVHRLKRFSVLSTDAVAPLDNGKTNVSVAVGISDGYDVTVRSLRHEYLAEDGTPTVAIDGASFEIRAGEFVAIVGPSGCGKTTLLNLLAGIERHCGAGKLAVAGKHPRAGNHDVGYMLARDCLLPWRRALQNAALALEMHGVDKVTRTSLAQEALRAVGLQSFERSYPAQLSQGMRQRVALARVFAARPKILLLDEPFSALDAQTRLGVQDAFLNVWAAHHTTVVLITHDLGEAITLADRVYVMTDRPGRIKAAFDIDLPRPRLASDVTRSSRYQTLYDLVWAELKSEFVGSTGSSH